jgi:UDP-N-acetylmuramate dehydrogenase
MDILSKLQSVVKGRFKLDEILAPYTSFQVGGPASYFYTANTYEDVLSLTAEAKKNNIPHLILGSGTNLLVSDNGFKGLVIKVNDNKIEVIGGQIKAGAGAILQDVVDSAFESGLSGIEWATGIPGTIGGAVVNNAGAFGGEMKDIVESVDIIRDEKILTLAGSDCQFIYRKSLFKTPDNNDYIVSILMNFTPGDKKQMKTQMDDILEKRNAKTDGSPSAGSIFKNHKLTTEEMAEFVVQYPDLPVAFRQYNTVPAAWLIEKCGLKSMEIGGAKISDQHSGRIINTGQATSENVIMLISLIKQKVRSKFSIQLMEEIEYVGL